MFVATGLDCDCEVIVESSQQCALSRLCRSTFVLNPQLNPLPFKRDSSRSATFFQRKWKSFQIGQAEQIQQGVEQRSLGPMWIVDPMRDALRAEPHFQVLLKKVDFKK